jgi:cell division protein FtsA
LNNHAILAIDIGTTKTTAIIAQNDLNNRINILGVGNAKSHGINKGSIVDINLASTTINDAINTAKGSCDTIIDRTFISVSGIHSRSFRSSGAVNVQSGQIKHNEIDQVLKMALFNAKIIPDYEVIHVLPLYFKIDDSNEITNPLDMNGSRLEVYANIVTVKKTALVNIENALKKSKLTTTSFVLNSYASSIAVLKEDQKKLGTVVLDLGGSTSELTIFKGQTICYNDFISIGSEHITNDLSILLHTPYNAANMIKNQYGTLLPISNDYNLSDTQAISKIKIPLLGNESESKEVPLIQVQPIIHARVEELLCLLKDKIINSGMYDKIDGGIVITGGMSKTIGIDKLASKIFANKLIKIASPINIQNGYVDFNDQSMSTVAGLLKYALDADPFFELDSNQELRKKPEIKQEILHEEPLITIKEPKKKKTFLDIIGKWL